MSRNMRLASIPFPLAYNLNSLSSFCIEESVTTGDEGRPPSDVIMRNKNTALTNTNLASNVGGTFK